MKLVVILAVAAGCGAAEPVSLVAVTSEPAGPHCAAGGVRIEVGQDLDGDGSLTPAEVRSTSYACGSTDGLLRVSTEPAGEHCAGGGQRIDQGRDANHDGQLEDTEVSASTYVCDGADQASLVRVDDEPAGPNCTSGGHAIRTGSDEDEDGELDEDEVDSTAYVCNPPVTELGGTLAIDDGDLIVRHGGITIANATSPQVGPEIHWIGNRGGWVTGIDVANNGGSRDFVLAGKLDWPNPGDTDDLVYIAHNGSLAPTVGIGMTPPIAGHRLEISAQDSEPQMGSLLVRRTPNQTGNLLSVIDSGGTLHFWLDAAYWLRGQSSATGASISVKANADHQRPLAFARADGTAVYGFQYDASEPTALSLRYLTTGLANIIFHATGQPSFPNGIATAGLRVTATAAPASSSAPCEQGQIAYDASYVYVCVADDTWKRSPLSSW